MPKKFDLCPVCESTEFEILAHMKSPVLPKLKKAPVAICKSCGFITMNPKPTPNFATECNQEWFVKEVNNSPNERARWEKFWKRIETEVEIEHVLDIGSRHGNALLFLKDKFPDLKCKAVELVDEFRQNLIVDHKVDAESFDISFPWPERFRGFDLVICRMVLEHLDRPTETMAQIRDRLNDDGLVYLSVPNAMNIREGTPITRDFFRPIHAHYFNCWTLVSLMEKCELYPKVIGVEGDIWGLFGRNKTEITDIRSISYMQQKNYMMQKIKQGKKKDYEIAAKMLGRKLLRKQV